MQSFKCQAKYFVFWSRSIRGRHILPGQPPEKVVFTCVVEDRLERERLYIERPVKRQS